MTAPSKKVLFKATQSLAYELVYKVFYLGLLVAGAGLLIDSLDDSDAYWVDRLANGLAWLTFFGASWATGKMVNEGKYTLGAVGLDILELALAYWALVSLGVRKFKLEVLVEKAPDTHLFMLLLLVALGFQQWWRHLLTIKDTKGQNLTKIAAGLLLLVSAFILQLPRAANCALSGILMLLTIIYSILQPKEVSFLRWARAAFLKRGAPK